MSGKWLDTQLQVRVPVPQDIGATGIQGEETGLYNPYRAYDRRDGKPLDNNDALIRILRNTDIDITLKTIGNAFFPRVVQVGTVPTILIEPNRSPRGYILINPNSTISGVVTSVTVFPVATGFTPGIITSAAINVSGHGGAAFFLNITATGGATGIQFDLQTLDPVSGQWMTAQADLFPDAVSGGAVQAGQYYANVGAIGIDNQARLQVTTVGGTVTGSVGATLKPSLAATIAGSSVFIGGPDVNTTIGFPLVSGQKEVFWLKENTAIYGVAAAIQQVNIFELQ